jgi:serine phosphatase RsbU (regulator of sigma subunit)
MPSRYDTPEALVEALHSRSNGARDQLWEWLRDPVHRLMQQLQARHKLPHRLERLTQHALHAAEAYLRTRPASDFHNMTLQAFRGMILLQLARQVVQPFGRSGDRITMAPDPLPETDVYSCKTLFMPSEKIGSFWFGGDWYGGRLGEDGTMHLLVADITGHGYAAYLLANALPAVWQKMWTEEGLLADPEPSDVLGAMHDLLLDCLPEDVYVECILLRLNPDGRVTMAPAGGSRLLLRTGKDNRLTLLKLRGLWLGLDRPAREDQQRCLLDPGDELLLGTDGIFDQLLDHVGADADLAQIVSGSLAGGGMLAAVQQLLTLALAARPQKDDITVVAIQRRSAPRD